MLRRWYYFHNFLHKSLTIDRQLFCYFAHIQKRQHPLPTAGDCWNEFDQSFSNIFSWSNWRASKRCKTASREELGPKSRTLCTKRKIQFVACLNDYMRPVIALPQASWWNFDTNVMFKTKSSASCMSLNLKHLIGSWFGVTDVMMIFLSTSWYGYIHHHGLLDI